MSTPCRVDVSANVWSDSRIIREIDWCRKRIENLENEVARRPRKNREIKDLLRQIGDKDLVLEYRRWTEAGDVMRLIREI